ncbi:hypothetical protein IGI04_036367 [Brassica rapa subsp. trilocularis]|uniref:Uncharacterized protein n=1 Tax=Brassica rapa subsp. trilocularis TaxID=1813537 RepID=A0ABQ7LF97_BRACM|nr:hypothetical protein IGI04_036367 [Brassica rapa subsp. trilocularis]
MCKVRDKSRIDLEVYLGANGRVCKDRVRQYGRVRTGEADVPGKLVQCLGKLLQKLTSSSHVILKPRRSLDDPAGCSTSQVEDGFIPGVQKLYVVVSHPLMTPMKKEGSWKQGRKWSDQPSFKALSKLFLIHCPRRKVIAFIWYWCGECNMKKGGVFDMESSRERSLEEGEVGVDTNSSLSCHVLWSFKELTLVPWLIDPNTIVSYLCLSLSDVSGSQDVFLVHHPSELKVGDFCPLSVQWRVEKEVVMRHWCEVSLKLTCKLGLIISNPSLRRGVYGVSRQESVQSTLGCEKMKTLSVRLLVDKSRIDLEVYLGANGRVCKDRVRQYGRVRTVRIRTDQGDPDLHNSAI